MISDNPMISTVTATKRLTFEEAIEQVLENSEIKKLSDAGKGLNWVAAVKKDIDAAHKLIDNLAEDLSKILGKKVKRTSEFQINRCDGLYPSNVQRINAIWTEFITGLKLWVRQICTNINAIRTESHNRTTYRYTFPLQNVNTTPYGLPPFDFVDEFNWIGDKYSFSNVSYKEPDKNNVIRRVKKKLYTLDGTHYNYSPAIIKGIRLYSKDEGGVYQGLVLTLGGGLPSLICDLWNVPSKDTWKNRFYYHCTRFFTHSLVLCSACLWLMLLIGIINWYTWSMSWAAIWNVPLIGIGAYLLVIELFVLSSFQESQEKCIPACRTHIPITTLDL